MGPRAERIYRLLLDREGRWVDAWLIHQVFQQDYKSPVFKEAMDELRRYHQVEHRFLHGKPHLHQYRLAQPPSPPTAAGPEGG